MDCGRRHRCVSHRARAAVAAQRHEHRVSGKQLCARDDHQRQRDAERGAHDELLELGRYLVAEREDQKNPHADVGAGEHAGDEEAAWMAAHRCELLLRDFREPVDGLGVHFGFSPFTGSRLGRRENSRKRRAICDAGVIPGRGTKFSHPAGAKPRSKRADIRASGIGRTGLRRGKHRSVRARRCTLRHRDACSPKIGARLNEL